ncbi:hypothetical protein CA267_001210 [Alteromonas pelagimontana]|uniref:Peptidoglycan-binding protein n=1 Tax=Alteromonas pelagimontana TaxID=1858656 RepID=A0A6M4M960_9ALTE|nr:CsiV family protein [Alteromonas pelagimontana]QJR79509.1 hypothetical protein CA267_001210 [Alteromonas pelagimontana]
MMYVRSVFSLLLLSVVTAPALAADDWWFDVEVIIFDRNVALTELAEQFEEADELSPYHADWDLIGEYLRPDISWLKQGLATCDTGNSPLWLPKPSIESIISDYEQWQTARSGASVGEAVNINNDTGLSTANKIPDSARQEYFGSPLTPTNASVVEPGAAQNSLESIAPQRDVTVREIADYWLEFSGINNFNPVTVPRFRFCEPQTLWLSWQNGSWRRSKPDNHLPYPDHIPITLDGQDWPESSRPHVLSPNQLHLTKLSQQIRQAGGLNRLLHIVWRQPVKFGEEKAASVRLFAGKNFADSFTLTGEQIKPEDLNDSSIIELKKKEEISLTASQDDFFSILQNDLDKAETVSFASMMAAVKQNKMQPLIPVRSTVAQPDTPIWQIDGELKVFLKYINRVPYLHIDTELFYRQPVPIEGDTVNPNEAPTYRLASVPFKQVRRVISKQLHYFDHPLFGMVVEIRRYKRPGEQE